MRTYSTGGVARMLGISRMTLLRWLKDGKIPEPRRVRNGGIDARVWTARHVERAKKFKAEHYNKRGRPKKGSKN